VLPQADDGRMDGLADSPVVRGLRAGAGSSTCSPFHTYAVGLSPLEPDPLRNPSPVCLSAGVQTYSAPMTAAGEPRTELAIRRLPSQSELDVTDSANRRTELPSQLQAPRARQLTFAQNPAPLKKPSPLPSPLPSAAAAAAAAGETRAPSGPEAISAAAPGERRCK
jgi:hypothetical protein